MRCPHQSGEFPGPLQYGYSSVGTVVEGPRDLLGLLVFCLYPHQTQYVVAADAVVPVPDDVPAARAVLAANLETALNALWDACPRLGDRISVVGAGSIGCLIAHLASRIAGIDVELIDVRTVRKRVADALGVAFALPADARRERDLVFHASGTEAGLRTALAIAASDTTVMEVSWFGDSGITLPLGADFHARRLALRSSQVGTVSPAARARFTHRSRLELALSLCADARLDALFSEEAHFEELPATLARLARPDCDVLCHRVRYD